MQPPQPTNASAKIRVHVPRTNPMARLLSSLLLALIPASALLPLPARALSCSTQATMPAADRDALLIAGGRVAGDLTSQNFDALQAALLPAIAGDWDGIKAEAQRAKPILQGGQLHWRNGYLLDATDLKGPADTQFFCSNADNSITVTASLHSLPPGRYGLLLGDFPGSASTGQVALILGQDGGRWKLGGLYVREGTLDGHDGVWFWNHAREQAQKKLDWSAWYSYDAARFLLLPVDFLSSPNYEKLNREQQQLRPPTDSLPLTLANPANTGKPWHITTIRLDADLHSSDIGLNYEATGPTDPAALRAESIAVMSAFIHLHPEIRDSFHGLWAFAEKDGKQISAIELAMHDIP